MSKKIYQIENFPTDNDSLLLNETVFHNANGYIGIRSNFEEGYPKGFDSIRGQYVNGFYDFTSMPQAEKLYGLFEEKQVMVNIADTQGIELKIEGEQFSMFTGNVIESIRTLDMEQGVTTRELIWESPNGKIVKLEIRRMTSFKILPLFLIEYSVTALNFSGEIEIVSTHIGEVRNYCNPNDPRVAGESVQHLFPEHEESQEDVSYMVMKTSKSNISICSAVRNTICGEVQSSRFVQENFMAKQTFTIKCKEGNSITLYKETLLCDSIRYPNPQEAAKTLLQEVREMGIDALYEEQRAYLHAYWNDCDIEVYGDEEVNKALHYNLYQLMQSVGKDPHCNIAAKGLSGEGYEGHYFWDTEMYMQPFYTLTAREIAKNLIRYRHTMLPQAKENARIMGHESGALYPWRTIMGKECSGYYVSGSAAYHINGAVAYAVVAYYLATKDIDFIKECGAEILIETARLWLDVGNYYKGGFHIHEVTGPDEYTCLVNNNYYTNAIAKYNLVWAVKFIELIQQTKGIESTLQEFACTTQELKSFKAAAESMYLPYDEKLGINPQDDSFLQKAIWDIETIPEDKKPLLLHYHPMYLYRHQICKQADTVMSHFILEDEQDIETIRKSFDYYEKVTTHDSSLSTCIFSIVAAKLGEVEKAYEYFGESVKLDLFNTHKNTKDGIHTANMGGTYMAIVYGFGGLRLKESGLYFNPILPDKWEGYQFSIQYENAKLKVKVGQAYCDVELLKGDTVTATIYGITYELTKEKLRIER